MGFPLKLNRPHPDDPRLCPPCEDGRSTAFDIHLLGLTCPQCGLPLQEAASRCPRCNAALLQLTSCSGRCSSCGANCSTRLR